MGLDYSYTQPSQSDDYGLEDSADSGYNQTEHDIMLDQAEIEAARFQYPPQPEVEFGFPKECYCSGQPVVDTAYTINDPGRRFYTCENRDDGDCHVWKWWDVAATEEIRGLGSQYAQLSDKVDYLSFHNDCKSQLDQVNAMHHETEQKLARLERIVCELGKKKSKVPYGFELVLGVMAVLVVIVGFVSSLSNRMLL